VSTRIDWGAAPYVFIPIPTCPNCGGPGYNRTRTESNGDGSTMKKVVCRNCGSPYKIVLESPVSGNWCSSTCDDERDEQ
jgi:hypothetical protein